MDGLGTGRLQLSGGTWTLGTSSGVTQVSNGIYDVVDSGSGWTMQLTYSGSQIAVGLNAQRIDPGSTGSYLKNVRFYRTADATDLAAGKVFRSAWKQTLVDLNPSAIRFMNWTGYNGSKNIRFENRAKPNQIEWSPGAFDYVTSPPYGDTSGNNQWTLASVTGTPVSMTHGEIATCRIGSGGGMVRSTGPITVSAITKANPGQVTATAHGFNTGDMIYHFISSGMTQLQRVPCTITVIDANTYTIGIDTTSFSTFTSGTARQWLTLNVGGRGAYPIVNPDGSGGSINGNSFIAAGGYYTFYFDKTISLNANTSQVYTMGAWVYAASGVGYNGNEGGTPLEVCTALINELMAMTSNGPIDMWITISPMAMLSMDPDYSAGSNFAIGAVGVCLNGANGYSGLNPNSKLYVEFGNETWNSAGGFPGANYLGFRGFFRWGGSTSDYASMASLRSMVMVSDILTGGFDRSRLKFILSGQGTIGMTPGALNDLRINGTTAVLTDPLNVGGVAPMSVHDYFAWAAYFDLSGTTWETNNLATIVAQWVADAGNATAQEADCASYVAGFEDTSTAGTETVQRYRDTLLPSYASSLGAMGKSTIMYEGGWNRSVSNGSTNQNNFLVAVKQSRSWANKLKGFQDAFDNTANAITGADYIEMGRRWGHIPPDTYTNAVGGVEWSGLDLAWKLLALRNKSKREFVVKT